MTAILPQGKSFAGRLFAAWHTLNGNGEMTGTTWIEESGGLGSPILITNTHSVGIVRDAVIEWGAKKFTGGGYSGDFSLPVVAETWDGFLNDINGFHIRKEHAFQVYAFSNTIVILNYPFRLSTPLAPAPSMKVMLVEAPEICASSLRVAQV